MDIKNLMQTPHRVHKKYCDFWNFLMESYEGGKDYIGEFIDSTQKVFAGGEEVKLTHRTHLFQHKKEKNDDFKKRVNMSYYYNFCAPIIDIYTNRINC